jgi:hypothetical protein
MRRFVLDHTALRALGAGNVVLARLLYGTPRDGAGVVIAAPRAPRLLVPALCLLRAGRRRALLAEHIAELAPLRVEPADVATVIALCGDLAAMDPHLAHAVHTAVRQDASIITTDPDQYPPSVRTVRLSPSG